MPDQEYDVFLSHASEDTAWCETLAERLRNDGVRVWFDQWELQPGDNLLARLNDGLARSRKLIAVWSANYFRDGKVWTLVESFSQLHGDPLSQDRPIIPLLIEDCIILPTFRNILFIDFRNNPDFDLRFRQLLQALDLPRREFAREEEFEFREHEIELDRRGRLSYKKGKRFEDEVATLYRLLGFEVKQDNQLSGVQIDLQIQQKIGGLLTQAIVECKDKRITANERDQILAQQNLAQKKLPAYRWIALSSEGFAAETRLALDEAGVSCLTYAELLRELVPLDQYNEHLIAEYETWVAENWRGEDWYIRPHLLTDITYEKQPALSHFAKWLGDSRSNFLVVLGDLGTGKSTLARFLAYNLAKSFASDPLRHPAPVLIPLKEVRKENSLESLIISHFSRRGLSGLSFPRFEHLVRLGKIILLFDAFDEMADRVRWEVTKGNFTELRRAADPGGAGKVILTCRTHYFKDRNEQVKLIGEGPRLSEIETELYRELRQQSNAEVVYLQEFNDEQIQAYLHKARPQSAAEDWQKIQSIYNLKELAQRPLLLEMIVKSLPKLAAGQTINAANLYTVYTNIWVEREEQKGRILDKQIKLQLMLELAWRLWHEEKDVIHYRELVPFVEKLAAGKVIELGDEEAEDIAREMQAATFLKRDDSGHFSFVHRSFMEFFLARKIYDEISGATFMLPVLNTRRFDRKIVYFLTWLDEQDYILAPLQKILISTYTPQVSENALQILYWSGRVKIGMEEKIEHPPTLRNVIRERIPAKVQLTGANLQEFVLEAVDFASANFTDAELTNANLNHASLPDACFHKANLQSVRAEGCFAVRADFRGANLQGIVLSGATLKDSDLTAAQYDSFSFVLADIRNCKGLALIDPLGRGRLEPFVQRAPKSLVSSLAYSPDGEILAYGGANGLITLHRCSNDKIFRMFDAHKDWVKALQFSPDGQLLASGSADGSIKLWNALDRGSKQFSKEHDGSVDWLQFSSDGTQLASKDTLGSVCLWDMAERKLLRKLTSNFGTVISMHILTNKIKLASMNFKNSVQIWDFASEKILHSLDGHTDWAKVAYFSSDGTKLAVASYDGSLRVWDVSNGKLLWEKQSRWFDYEGEVNALNFSSDGLKLASVDKHGTIQVREVVAGELKCELAGSKQETNCLTFSPNKLQLASGNQDGSVQVWEVSTRKLLRVLESQKKVNSIHISPDGMKLASGGEDQVICIWEMNNKKGRLWLGGHQDSILAVHFSPDGKWLASGSRDDSTRLWDATSGTILRTLDGNSDSLQFSPDGLKLAGDSVRIWDMETGKVLKELRAYYSRVQAISFSLNGERLMGGTHDFNIWCWDIEKEELLFVFDGHTNPVNSIHLSPNGTILASGSSDKTIRLWDASTGEKLRVLKEHLHSVNAIKFFSDGTLLASGSDDHTVRLWEVETGKCLQVLEGHLGPVYTVCFAPNGKYLVAAGAAGRLQFWDHEKGETFLYRYAFGPGAWLDLLPDGRFDASPEGMRYLCYTEQGTFNSYTAEELVKEFYDPQAVQKVLDRYVN